jgi:hypothetical protein
MLPYTPPVHVDCLENDELLNAHNICPGVKANFTEYFLDL